MEIMTRVKLVLADAPKTGIPGVKMSLFDKDVTNPDDYLGAGVTDENGEVLFAYDSSAFVDSEDGPEWSIASLADLFVVVYDASGAEVLNTRDQTVDDKLPARLVISIDRTLAEKHGLLQS
ncbi:MAG: hypothetical protein U0822_01695 [Anaerolineae bacterium]